MLLKKFLIMVFILINIFSFSAIDLINTENRIIGKVYESYEEIIPKNDSLNGYILNLNDFDEELCYLCLGTIRNYSLIESFFKVAGV